MEIKELLAMSMDSDTLKRFVQIVDMCAKKKDSMEINYNQKPNISDCFKDLLSTNLKDFQENLSLSK